MIEVEFRSVKDRLIGFRVCGHSGYAEKGSDIICASISSAAYMTANTVTDVIGINPQVLSEDDGFMEMRLTYHDAAKAENILSGFRLHMLQLEEQYPKYIKLKFSEV